MWSNKKYLFLRIFILLLLVGTGFAISYSVTNDSRNNSPTTKPELGTKDSPHIVELKNSNKDPVDLIIKTGEYVQFNSKDGADHQLIQGVSTMTEHGPTEHAPSPLDSGLIKSDEGYLLQFNTVGKFEFHDNYDHDFTLTVIVYDPKAKTKIN